MLQHVLPDNSSIIIEPLDAYTDHRHFTHQCHDFNINNTNTFQAPPSKIPPASQSQAHRFPCIPQKSAQKLSSTQSKYANSPLSPRQNTATISKRAHSDIGTQSLPKVGTASIHSITSICALSACACISVPVKEAGKAIEWPITFI